MDVEYIDDWMSRIGSATQTPDLIDSVLADTNEISAIAGRSGIGKTNLCLQLAYSLSTGTPFLGFNVPNAVPVAYLGFEGDPKKLQERILKIKRQFPDTALLFVKHPCKMFKLTRSKTQDFRSLINGYKVIIIDPVRYIVPGDYTDPKEATLFMEVLQEEMRFNNSLSIVVFYHKKMDSKTLNEPGDLFQIKGATEWGDMSSTVLMVERTRQQSIGGRGPGMGFQSVSKDNVTLHFAKTRNSVAELSPINLKFNRNMCMYEKI